VWTGCFPVAARIDQEITLLCDATMVVAGLYVVKNQQQRKDIMRIFHL